MMFCRKCGSEMEEGAKFCKACGAPVQDGSASGTGAAGSNSAFQNFQNTEGASFGNAAGNVAKKLDIMDIIVLAGAVLMVLASFLPYATASFMGASSSTSLMDGGDGWFFIGVAVLTAVFVFIRKWLPEVIFAGIGVVLMIYESADAADILSETYGIGKKGIGFYLLIIAAIVMLGGAVAKKIWKK